MTLAPSTNHVERGAAKLLAKLRSGEKLKGLLGAWLRPGQQAEDFTWLVLEAMSIESDVDIVLDRIGKIVGRGRNSLSNELYRYALRAQIRINRSHGRHEDFLDVLRLSVHDDAVTFDVTDQQIATVQIDMYGSADADQVWQNAKQVKGGGVRLFFTYPGGDGTNDFILAEEFGSASDVTDDPEHGFGWTGDAGLGGTLAGEFVL